MSEAIIISEFEAAQEVKMSPTLLRWFTSYAPKNDGVKLKYTEKNGVYYYDKNELINFSSFLNLPWAKSDKGSRPRIPIGIAREIKTECHHRCPACNSNIGELAHIKPVAKTFSNHPHNLIFLCPTHHTEYDFGFKYNNLTEDDITTYKKGLLKFQSLCWEMQSEIVLSYLSLINRIGRVEELEKTYHSSINEQEFENLFALILKKIDAPNKIEIKTDKEVEIIKSVDAKRKNDPRHDAYSFLSVRDEVKKEYADNDDLVECRLCHSKGSTVNFEICPACHGDGFVDREEKIDFSIYEMQECPLCIGLGQTPDFETCPACYGEGQLTKEQIEIIDFSKYKMKSCPLCKGKGATKNFETCPACHGERQLAQEQIDSIDFSLYEMESCPLCRGNGATKDFETCPACHGDGQLAREQIDNIDFSVYEIARCPLCKGKGATRDFETCPACHGDGQLAREQIANIDFSRFEMVICPLCNGKGETKKYDTCPPCNGDGKLPRGQLEIIDFGMF